MDKTELAITVATGLLGAFLNTSSPKVKNEATKGGYVHVQENAYVLVSAYSTPNIKEVSVKYLDGSTTFVSDEYIDCPNKRHKIIKMQHYENGALQQAEVVDFPKWEANNRADNVIWEFVCK